MTRKLFLASAGLPPETRGYFLKLLTKSPAEAKVCFIPTAAWPEIDQSFVEKSKNELRAVGIAQIKDVDLKSETKESLEAKLSDCDVIFVNGGNTFYLLEEIRKSGFDQIIPSLLDQGKIYLGVSAGSYVACPTIEMAGWKHQDRNRFGLKEFTALNLVPFLISAHFEEKHRPVIEENVEKIKYPLIVLTDKQAVQVIGDKFEVVGEGEVLSYHLPQTPK